MPEKLTALVEATVVAWNKWANAPGWDNNEYDELAACLNALEDYVKENLCQQS